MGIDSNWANADWLQTASASTAVPATIALIIVFIRLDWKPDVKADFTKFEELEMAMNASSGESVAIENSMNGGLLPVPYTYVYF